VTDPVRAAFAEQAGWCEKLDSPFTAMLCRLLGERLDHGTAVGRRTLDWPGTPWADALALRLCGGLQSLVRSGRHPALGLCYPPHPLPEAETLWSAVVPALDDGELLTWLDRAPQTNEVGRAAVLMSGLLVIADRFPQPLDLLELGASAGLNLLLDRYGHNLGGVRAGDPDAPLQLRPEWTGPPPPNGVVQIGDRRGVDISPLYPASDRDRLLAYVWPDQAQRRAQLASALDVAARYPVAIDQADAADWLELRLAEPPRPGMTRLVFHSVAFHYFPPAAQERIATLMAEHGARATPQSPLAWLRYEQEPGEPHFSLQLRLWPIDAPWRLAECHPHGRWVRWLGWP
jgi:hypothetical protein